MVNEGDPVNNGGSDLLLGALVGFFAHRNGLPLDEAHDLSAFVGDELGKMGASEGADPTPDVPVEPKGEV